MRRSTWECAKLAIPHKVRAQCTRTCLHPLILQNMAAVPSTGVTILAMRGCAGVDTPRYILLLNASCTMSCRQRVAVHSMNPLRQILLSSFNTFYISYMSVAKLAYRAEMFYAKTAKYH